VIAVHISNIAVDLAPPIANLAKLFGMKTTLITTDLDDGVIISSEWILLTRGNSLNVPAIRSAGKPLLAFTNHQTNVWTDDYSDILSLLGFRGISMGPWMRKGGIP
jgi:hypothetical protein